MEGRMGWVVKVSLLVAVAGLLQGSVNAQGTVHVVGGSLGWIVPPGGPIAYSTWAANQTFVVGDVLVFNFTNGSHDVVEVSKPEFDSCNATNSSNTIMTMSPANYTLGGAGSRYFICTFQRHCSLGQKLAINITATSPSPVPVPAPSPSIAEAPSDAPTRSPVTYTVGDAAGWNVLAGGATPYQLWAANKTFMVGDTLVFNFVNRTHDVAEVSKAAFNSCNTNTTISLSTNPPVRIVLTTPGEHYYTCTFSGHCSLGQKLAINVIGTSTSATPPSSTPGATPPSSSATPPPPPSSATTPTGTPSTPSPPPPPPASSASSLGITGLTVAVLSIVTMALMY
ncbi:hypothetical protein MLD38_006814 [Melastoma candidum]|uniref:Uncharacterized protein n=1 Tax=Melastoma candidum TaxID=119954 RepID=A0ACB9RXJ8_9MYRT|nr:hypothetical protein MLD38_006814 [Melastoma candidum]